MRLALFVTCVNDTLFPETGKSVVRVLRRLGHEVEFPYGQVCCGQMHFDAGHRRDTVPLVRSFVETFEPYDAVITPSGSCTAMVREHHATVARQAGGALVDGVARTSPKVYELSEFLVDVLGVTDVGASFPHSVAYHPSCHSLRRLRVGDRPIRLLRAVRGLALMDLPHADECCGFGGTFAVGNAETSVAMGDDKVAAALEAGAQVLCAVDNSCLTHVGGLISRHRAGIRVLHLADILASTGALPDVPPFGPALAAEPASASEPVPGPEATR
ncbi:(Fe-S)-binding protein [Embleya sp. NBC_00896]|uniref:(Fe-S)-binding protein n=1 Tax=Embleya sp. NBC_00896 TaxID=2975961 RepID=UPI00386CF7E7|nr:(Fe-S)-binding protein [Embleya sp. NBC_00896]